MEEVILRYVEPIYRFCCKRLSSPVDAEDLSQEILLCILQGMRHAKINNMDGYVWKIAHNRYARMMEVKKRDVAVLCGDQEFAGLPDQTAEDDADEYQTVFHALHTLSETYRSILVDFYVRGRDVNAIAQRHAISAEAVKWRLHAGREKIRERMEYMEKTYDKITMHVMCNGSFGPDRYLGTQVYKAIAKACYDRPLTIEEISLATGIPTLYLEEALEHMVFGDAIEKSGQKYSTCFLITNQAQRSSMRRFLNGTVVAEVADRILDYIGETEEILRGIGFYGSDFPLSRLLHILVPAILYSTAERMRDEIPDLPKRRPVRKDGGSGWFIVSEGMDRLGESDSGCNGYYYDANGGQSGRFLYYWVGNTLDDGLDKTLRDARFFLNSIGPDGACFFSDDADAATAFANGLCENREGRTYPAIAVFTEKQYSDFCQWAAQCTTVDSIWKQWIASLFQAYRMVAPKRLADQIGGNVDGCAFNLSAFVLKELRARELLEVPQAEGVFTGNLLLVRG